jgi:hypothetical protein
MTKRRPFPIGAASEAREYAEFLATVLPDVSRCFKHYHAYLADGSAFGIEMLSEAQDRVWTYLNLLWMGSPPPEQERIEARLAPAWARLRELQESNQAKAKAELARRGR